MKGTRTWISILAGVLLLAAQSAMSATITGSAHDFTTKAWSGGKICIACHTPHNSDITVTDAPLWNHKNSTQTYTLYSSPTMNATTTQPGGNSKLCLSCHDGTVAVDSFGGATGTTMISTANNLGNTLKNDHPIGFVYNATLATTDASLFNPDTKLVTIGSGAQSKGPLSVTSLMLFSGKMECDSCHDVHNTFTVPAPPGALTNSLLKVTSVGSAICLACHNK